MESYPIFNLLTGLVYKEKITRTAVYNSHLQIQNLSGKVNNLSTSINSKADVYRPTITGWITLVDETASAPYPTVTIDPTDGFFTVNATGKFNELQIANYIHADNYIQTDSYIEANSYIKAGGNISAANFITSGGISLQSKIVSGTIVSNAYSANYQFGDTHKITLSSNTTLTVTNIPEGQSLLVYCKNANNNQLSFGGNIILNESGNFLVSFINMDNKISLLGQPVKLD